MLNNVQIYFRAFQVVSEDELPASKKDVKESRKRKPDEARDGYDPGSPTSESESSNKKQAVSKVKYAIHFIMSF